VQKIDVTRKEYDLLAYMIRNPNQILSREMINKHAFDNSLDGSSNIIDVYVNYLRNKLDKPFSKKLIHTVRGKGYILKGQEGKISTIDTEQTVLLPIQSVIIKAFETDTAPVAGHQHLNRNPYSETHNDEPSNINSTGWDELNYSSVDDIKI
jgi:DNA-binding winged helix-turn-helix (wHTH) protein